MTDLSQPPLPGTLPDKRQVAASFSRAAASYDSVAALQRAVGMALLEKLPSNLAPARWLDMGSGTGHFSRVLAERFAQSSGVAVDIAEGMLRHAREQGGARHHVAGDAEHLPLRDGCVDLLFSSLAVQWCGQFASVLGEARRVLRPGGVLAFSSLCVGTLDELRASWQAVDGMVHVNRFRRFEDYQRLCGDSGLELIDLERRPHVLHYPDVRSLTHELKALGAHNLNPGRPSGLTGRARMQGLLQAYEQYRQVQGLPATYQVVYGVLHKPSDGEQ
ncbi:malonyl-ACP O-methyltransferase BioC [Pseudomonas mosselii]|uniref:Malonyl-[acyl-carrier protein] O-methyltransferase n=1 Tax=Pseudomonas mosselii TaxID=78327 RepID=A0ABX9AZC4_9PSED|nr:malonyl-ACP O-methyltransferase BioC [Pseudomonas mosselii]MCL8300146.1 malonyl-ACP O-methyltransferase BioC [Pseudomonas mosselii]MCL8338900.1 malonyl-ACP O-methyltransferase BioC [Pseudomonas mosselii]MCU9532571.1 malonyl-ACP O-methyltransferase BioC [Pseudomonas mosselii]MCU9537710.1 malonyl-ACP O-methyltransferase BioC [Pseudomonas mosselii]MCU9545676.1 malonyl-ACP O-methyltransferase BioC [Pseudomonas mosselii]